MPISKDTKSFGLPWKEQYGYFQVVKVDDTVYLSDRRINPKCNKRKHKIGLIAYSK